MSASTQSEGLHPLFRQQAIRQVNYVADAGHAGLIRLCEADDSPRAMRL